MPQRRRYATAAELAELLATPDTTQSDFAAVLDALGDCGAPVDALVMVMTDVNNKPLTVARRATVALKPGTGSDHMPIKPPASELADATALLQEAWSVIANVDGGTLGEHHQTSEWRTAAVGWREKFHNWALDSEPQNAAERVEPVNLEEPPEDAARRFAGDLVYAQELLVEGRSIMEEMDKATGERLNRDTLHRARVWHTASRNFPHKPEGI